MKNNKDITLLNIYLVYINQDKEQNLLISEIGLLFEDIKNIDLIKKLIKNINNKDLKQKDLYKELLSENILNETLNNEIKDILKENKRKKSELKGEIKKYNKKSPRLF